MFLRVTLPQLSSRFDFARKPSGETTCLSPNKKPAVAKDCLIYKSDKLRLLGDLDAFSCFVFLAGERIRCDAEIQPSSVFEPLPSTLSKLDFLLK